MIKVWNDDSWDEYLWWQKNDKRGLRKINDLIREIERSGGIEKPGGKGEILSRSKYHLRSVRIDQHNRLTYKVQGNRLFIVGCKGHYENKDAGEWTVDA